MQKLKKLNDLSRFCILRLLCYPFKNLIVGFLFQNKEVHEKN